MNWIRALLLCLCAMPAAARDATRFTLQDGRTERSASASRSGRFEAAASARAVMPTVATGTRRFELAVVPECDPAHVFSNGFE